MSLFRLTSGTSGWTTAREVEQGQHAVCSRSFLGTSLEGTLRLLRTGVVPAATHGTRATGLSVGMIRHLDSLAFNLLGDNLSGEMPWYRPAIATIVAWMEACFDLGVQQDDLFQAWRAAAK